MFQRLFGWAFWPWEKVSLGDGCYISGKKANELARMALDAERRPEGCIDITRMSDEEALALLSRREAP